MSVIWTALEQYLKDLIMDNMVNKGIIEGKLNVRIGPSDQFLYDSYKDSIIIAEDNQIYTTISAAPKMAM